MYFMLNRMIIEDCPVCGKSVVLRISGKQHKEWEHYILYGRDKLIQDALPDFDKFEREFIKTKLCLNCQEKIFDAKVPEYKEPHKWIIIEDSLSNDKWRDFLANAKEKRQIPVDALINQKDSYSVEEKIAMIALLGEDYYVDNKGEIIPMEKEGL